MTCNIIMGSFRQGLNTWHENELARCLQVGDAAVLHDTAPAFKAFITAARASPGACRQFHPGQPIPLASLLSSCVPAKGTLKAGCIQFEINAGPASP